MNKIATPHGPHNNSSYKVRLPQALTIGTSVCRKHLSRASSVTDQIRLTDNNSSHLPAGLDIASYTSIRKVRGPVCIGSTVRRIWDRQRIHSGQ